MSDSISAKVESIIQNVLYSKDEIPHAGAIPPGAIIVDGITGSFGLHPDRLAAHKDEIAEILAEMNSNFFQNGGGGWSFLNLCVDKHGNQWTGEHRIMEMLCVLAIGLDLGKWMLHRSMWPAMPGGMPYIVFK